MSKTLYIHRLGEIELSEVEFLFSSVGDVADIRAEIHPDSRIGTRFGVVEMATEQQAADCIDRFNGQFKFGQTLSVSSNKPICRYVENAASPAKKPAARKSRGKR
ncbi:MAG: hypothetical protein AB7G93_06680 [Bdellovibrionales bacterium]